MQLCIHNSHRIQLKFLYLPLKAIHLEVPLCATNDGTLSKHNVQYFLRKKLTMIKHF